MTDACLHLPIELPAKLGGGEARHARSVGVTIGVPNHAPPVVILAISEPSAPGDHALYLPLDPTQARRLATDLMGFADQAEGRGKQ